MRVASPKRDARQRQILDAALRVFARDGFDGASVANIADEAGIAKGSVYLYFDSKEALAGELVRHVFTHDDGDSALSNVEHPLLRLVEFCAQQEKRILSLGEFAPIVLHMWGHVGKSENNAIARGIRQISGESLFVLETLLERARQIGELPGGADIEFCSRALLAMCYGMIQQRVTMRGDVQALKRLPCEEAMKVFLRGLGAKI
jgi:TetR/AcrR family fatty acid metabolism transcriptional regulator